MIKAARYGWPYCRFHYFIGPVYSNDWFTAKTARLNGSRNDKPPSRLRVHEVHLASKISIAIWWLCWLGRTTFSSSHQIHRSVLMQCGLDSWLQPVTCFCFCWTLEIKDCPGLFWQRESHIYIYIYNLLYRRTATGRDSTTSFFWCKVTKAFVLLCACNPSGYIMHSGYDGGRAMTSSQFLGEFTLW